MKKQLLNISLITTCLNEENAVLTFLDSIEKQTVLPGEVIIVDALSNDRTVDRITYFVSSIQEKKLSIKIITKKGNRSIGRNEAVRCAKNEIILCSDVGCVLDKNWVKNITIPFQNSTIDVVSGFYKPITHSLFEKCLSTYTSVMPDKIDPDNFLPSSRSVAFRKSAWKEVGGYPIDLDTCEDLVFDKKLKEKGFQFVFQKNAIVYWPQQKNILQAARQFYSYAKGDGKAHYFRKSTPFLFGRYFFAGVLILFYFIFRFPLLLATIYLLFIVYLLWTIHKNYRYVQNWQALVYLPLLQFTADLTVLAGISIGYLSRKNETKEYK